MGKSMRMVMTVRTNKQDAEKIRDEKKEKLIKLQQKFLEKNKEVIKNNPIKDDILEDKKKEFITKKIIDKDIKKQLDNTNKKLEEFRDKDKKNKEIINRIKIQNYNLINENNELKELNKGLYKKIDSYVQELESLKIQLNEATTLLEVTKRAGNRKALLLRDDRIAEQRKHLTHMRNKIEKYKKTIKTLSTGEEINIDYLKEKIGIYALENSKLREQILELEQKNNNLSQRLLSDIEVGKDDKNINNIIHKRSYGILKTIEDKTYFIDIDGNKTIADVEKIKFDEDVPCRAKFENIQIAKIQKIYNENNKFVEKVINKDKNCKIKDNKEEFLYEGVDYKNLYNVLIIGSENKEEYTRVLKRIGFKVSWYDSYEGNVVRLKNMINRYDIVLCLTSHCRHYASNLMTYMIEHDKGNKIKYNLMENDNVDNLVGRVRYVIENLNE